MLPIYASAAQLTPTLTSTSLPASASASTPTPWATALQLPCLVLPFLAFPALVTVQFQLGFGFLFVFSFLQAAWHKRNEWYIRGNWQNFTSSMASIYLSGFKRLLLPVLARKKRG